MRPSSLHLGILAALMIPGIALYLAEAMSAGGSGLFVRFAATKVYWLSFAVYAAGSTTVVAVVYLLSRSRGAALSSSGVLLSHLLLVGCVWLVVSLGLHDRIQDAWRSLGASRGRAVSPGPAARPRPLPSALSAPMRGVPPAGRIKPAGPAASVEALDVSGDQTATPQP